MKGDVTDMRKPGVALAEVLESAKKDKEFAAEYNRLMPRYDLIKQIINARIEQHITQAELALRMGTKKSNISRLESGNYNPSLDFIIKAAHSLGKQVKVELK